jgi:type II secretory pathway pseudopilin PulG
VTRRIAHASRPGLSLVEAVLSIAIVGGLLASVLTVVGVAAQRAGQAEQSSRAAWLARDLLAEIASRPCADRAAGDLLSGLDAVTGDLGLNPLLEAVGADLMPGRTAFNDIFDYHAWTSTPPVDVEGTPIPGFDGWTRSVTVTGANPATLASRSLDKNCAYIVVTVSVGARTLHTETLVRSAAADALRLIEADEETDSKSSALGSLLSGLLGG